MRKETANGRRKHPAAVGEQTAESETLTYQLWQESFADPQKRRTIIQQIGERIGREFHPEKIILFGSQAYGVPQLHSDIDLLVVLPHIKDALEQAVAMLKQLNLPLSIDLLARTPQQLQQRVAMGDRFIKEILARGQVIYETHHAIP